MGTVPCRARRGALIDGSAIALAERAVLIRWAPASTTNPNRRPAPQIGLLEVSERSGRRWRVTDTPTRLRDSIWAASPGERGGLYGLRFQAADDDNESVVLDVYKTKPTGMCTVATRERGARLGVLVGCDAADDDDTTGVARVAVAGIAEHGTALGASWCLPVVERVGHSSRLPTSALRRRSIAVRSRAGREYSDSHPACLLVQVSGRSRCRRTMPVPLSGP